MRSDKDAKAMAKSLRDALAARNVSLSHSECLEIVARQFGVTDWNTLSSKLIAEERRRPKPRAVDTGLPQRSMPPHAPDTIQGHLPLLPLRDVVVYPGVLMPIFTGRPRTIRAAEIAMRGDQRVMLVTQRQPNVNEPAAEHLHQIGTVATIKEMLAGPMPSWRVLVEGTARARLDVLRGEDYLQADVTVLSDIYNGDNLDAARRNALDRFEQLVRLREWRQKAWKTPPEAAVMENIHKWFSSIDASRLADAIAAHVPLSLTQKQEVLELLEVRDRLEYVDAALRGLEQTGSVPGQTT